MSSKCEIEERITRCEASRRLAMAGCALLWPRAGAWCDDGTDRPQARGSAELEAVLERARRRHELPGLGAAIVSGTRPTVSGVVGVRRWGHPAPIQLEDRFHIASCTKSWTATLAAAAVR